MRLDHIAYRVKDRHETANLVTEIFGYTIDEEIFDDTIESISATKIRRKMRDEGDLS